MSFPGIDCVDGVVEVNVRPRICGIYFLLRGKEVVYVGQSCDVESRVRNHFEDRESKNFDRAVYLPVPREQLNEQEVRWIEFFDPPENRAHTRRRKGHIALGASLSMLKERRGLFGTPTILDLALTNAEKNDLAMRGIYTVRKLARNRELSEKYSEALSRFFAYRTIP